MKRILFSTWLLLLIACPAISQSTHQLDFGMQGQGGVFQDRKYSDVHYGGFGAGGESGAGGFDGAMARQGAICRNRPTSCSKPGVA